MRDLIKIAVSVVILSTSFYSSTGYALSTNEIDKLCQTKQQTMDEIFENGSQTTCYFKDTSLLAAYDKFRQFNEESESFFAPSLTRNKDMSWKCKSGCEVVNYRWSGSNKLNIEQFFPGGESHFEFVQKSDGTHLEIRDFPD